MSFEGAQWVWWVRHQTEGAAMTDPDDDDPGHLLPDDAWSDAQRDAAWFAANPPHDEETEVDD